MRKDKEYYIDPEQLKLEIQRYNQQNIASDVLGNMIMLMCDNILKRHNFAGYGRDLKDEMKSYACFRVLKGLKNIQPDRTGRQMFNYLTTAIMMAYVQTINKHHKHLERQDALIRAAVEQMRAEGLYESMTRLVDDEL